MQTKSILFAAAAAFALTAALVACDKNKNENGKDNETEGGQTSTPIKVAETQAGDTLQIRYNGALDLSKIFSAAQPEDSSAKLLYVVERQPEFVEGDSADYTAVNAYSVRGDTLFAAPDVRVPDAVSAEGRLRVVREGKLKVLLAGVDSLTYTIKMTDKPALTPVISLGEGIAEKLAGATTLTLLTTGEFQTFPPSAFVITPAIDFGEEDIRVGRSDTTYITAWAGIPRAGGRGASVGSGDFIVAYHKDYTLEEVLANENLPQVRLSVNVELGAATAVVGIVPNTESPATWKAGAANKQKQLLQFVKAKLDNGEEILAQELGSAGFGAFTFVSGYYSQTTSGANDVYTVTSGKYYPDEKAESPWRTGNLMLKNTELPAGSAVTFKISVAKIVYKDVAIEHLGEDAWTVDITTTLQ